MRRLKEAAKDSKGLGEALADLGLMHLRMGNVTLAIRLLREGVANLEAAGSTPFAVRAKKRLALGLLLSGHPVLAVRELSAAHELASENQIFDQITPPMNAVHQLIKVLGGRKSPAGDSTSKDGSSP